MYCMKCGEKLPDDALFCFKCGSRTGERMANEQAKDDLLASSKGINSEWNENSEANSQNCDTGTSASAGIGSVALVLILFVLIAMFAMFFKLFGWLL